MKNPKQVTIIFGQIAFDHNSCTIYTKEHFIEADIEKADQIAEEKMKELKLDYVIPGLYKGDILDKTGKKLEI